MKTRILFTVLLLIFCVKLFAQTSGTCGENLTWALVDSTLTISGTGYMDNYSSSGNTPWCEVRSNIKKLVIGNGVLDISQSAFSNCENLLYVEIGKDIEKIGNYCFRNSSSLLSINIPENVNSIGTSAFYGCNSLPVINNIRYADTYLVQVIDRTQSSYSIKPGTRWIGSSAFFQCKEISSISIPNSVISIEQDAFCDCDKLTTISIPNSVTNIGALAFEGCKNLVSVSLGKNVATIGSCAFYHCSSLTSIFIPNSIIKIDVNVFLGCNSLSSIQVEDNNGYYDSRDNCNAIIETSSNTLIAGCNNTIIPITVTSIGSGAFAELNNLIAINIPNNVTNIGKSAFNSCSSLTSITIPNSVTTIEESAFTNCKSLSKVFLGKNILTLGRGAFSNRNKTKIYVYSKYNFDIGILDGNNEIIYYDIIDKDCVFANINNKLKLVWYLSINREYLDLSDINGMQYDIDDEVFQNLPITKLIINNNVSTIGKKAFANCKESETLVLGNSIQEVEDSAFAECKRITDIYCYAERIPDIVGDPFTNVSRRAYLWVLENRVRNYNIDTFWGEFDVQAMGAEPTNTTQVVITPDYNTANIAWPAIEGVDSYELVIKDRNGNEVCTLVFNAEGQLISIAFRAPSKNHTPEQTEATGFKFTITGLESGTHYDYILTAKDITGNILKTYTGSFTTESTTALDNLFANMSLEEVLANKKTQIYTLHGIEVSNMRERLLQGTYIFRLGDKVGKATVY